MSKRGLAVPVLCGMVVQATIGLGLQPYRDVSWISLGWLGNDAVTLLLVCPLLAAALTGRRVDIARWHLLRLGLFGYAVYNFAFYMLGAELNAVFPLYIAVFALAVAALARELDEATVAALAAAFPQTTPARWIGGYLVAVAVGLAAVWLTMWALHVFAGQPAPGSPDVFRLVAALDLGFMVPALGVGGVLLWQRRAFGFVLAAVAGIQASLYLLVLSVNSLVSILRGLTAWPGELPIWLPLCVATAAATGVLLWHAKSERSAAVRD